MAIGHFVLGYHNFTVTALGSCVKWPLYLQIMCLAFKYLKTNLQRQRNNLHTTLFYGILVSLTMWSFSNALTFMVDIKLYQVTTLKFYNVQTINATIFN